MDGKRLAEVMNHSWDSCKRYVKQEVQKIKETNAKDSKVIDSKQRENFIRLPNKT